MKALLLLAMAVAMAAQPAARTKGKAAPAVSPPPAVAGAPKVQPVDISKGLMIEAVGGRARVIVENSDTDGATGPFFWSLKIEDRDCAAASNEVELGVGTRAVLECSVALAEWRDFSPMGWGDFVRTGWLKGASWPATLRIAATREELAAQPCKSCKEYSGLATVTYWRPETQEFVNTLTLLILLIAGGWMSNMIGLGLPNLQNKIRLRAQLTQLKYALPNSVAGLDPELWARLFAHRGRLKDYLARQSSWSRDTAALLISTGEQIQLLRKRTSLAARVVDLERSWLGANPTRFRRDTFKKELQPMLRTLRLDDSSETQIAAAAKTLGDLEGRVPGLADAAFQAWTATELLRLNTVPAALHKLAPHMLAGLIAKFAGLSGIVPGPPRYHEFELVLLKMGILKRYSDVAASPNDIPGFLQEVENAELRDLQKAEAKVAELEVRPITKAHKLRVEIVVEPSKSVAASEMVNVFAEMGTPQHGMLAEQGYFEFDWSFEGPAKYSFKAKGQRPVCFFRTDRACEYKANLTVTCSGMKVTAKETIQVVVPERQLSASVNRIELVRAVSLQLMVAAGLVMTVWPTIAQLSLPFAVIAVLAAGYGGDSIKAVVTGGAAALKKATKAVETGEGEPEPM
jgi:hypothetical protein